MGASRQAGPTMQFLHPDDRVVYPAVPGLGITLGMLLKGFKRNHRKATSASSKLDVARLA
jgi:hypothetical protein